MLKGFGIEVCSKMNKLILSNIAFLLGLIGVLIALASFFGFRDFGLYGLILPILFGLIGFVICKKIKKNMDDDIIKAGLILNPIAIILGAIQFFI